MVGILCLFLLETPSLKHPQVCDPGDSNHYDPTVRELDVQIHQFKPQQFLLNIKVSFPSQNQRYMHSIPKRPLHLSKVQSQETSVQGNPLIVSPSKKDSKMQWHSVNISIQKKMNRNEI